MITYYHKTLKSKQLKMLKEFKAGSWIYVVQPTNEELRNLIDKFDLDQGHVEDALDVEEMPRLEREDDQMYFFTRFAYSSDDLLVETTSLLFILHPECLITISLEPISRMEKITNGKLDINTTQPAKLVLQILDQIDDQYEEYINQISRQIKGIRSRLRVEEIRNKDFVNFVNIEDELNEFMTALTPMTPILKRLMLGKHFKLYADDKELLEDLLLNNEQSLEACRSNIKSVVNIREAYSTIMSNDLNRIIRVLTVVTVVISIPTLIASIYGMNVDLPFARSPFAFSLVMIISVGISLTLLWYFKFKRWL